MAATALSQPGAVKNAGDATALFLKVFSGEVLEQFQTASATLGKTMERTITSGKSAQFPVMGRATSAYMTQGENLIEDGSYLQNPQSNERVIVIDDLLVAPLLLTEVDELKNHYDVRAPYAQELGRTLARTMDQQILRLVANAAQEADNGVIQDISGGYDPAAVAMDGTAGTDGPLLVTWLHNVAKEFDEKDVPMEDRYAFLRPQEYHNLLQAGSTVQVAVNRDYGGGGSFAQADIPMVAGIKIIKTNHTPGAGDIINSGPSKYQGDFTLTRGVAMHKSAIGTVKLRDISLEMEWKPEYQATFMVAKMLVGHDWLRAESCARITDNA